MKLLLEGIGWGLVLSLMVGPLVFAIIQAALEKGFRAGFAIGAGIWISDLIFIIAVYVSINYLVNISNFDSFKIWLGIIGGFVLIGVGMHTFFSRPPDFEKNPKQTKASYLKLSIIGFLINTLNPFTFFFWITITATMIIDRELNSHQAFIFYAGILATIILSDSAKAYLAKAIRPKLKPSNLVLIRRITGTVLFLFGIALMIRVLFE